MGRVSTTGEQTTNSRIQLKPHEQTRSITKSYFLMNNAANAQSTTSEKPMNMCAAINDALHVAMSNDPKTLVFGEDVSFGGVFRCTVGLAERFGGNRVFNTPLSEQGIAGFAIGAASEGLVPIAEIQFADYIFPAFDQLANEAAKYRYRSGGKFDVGGLTIRAPYGAVGHGGHYHSQSPEAFFTHIPGLKVVIPSSPKEAKGLLLSSIRDDNPVIFFEAKMMYRTSIEDVPEGKFEIPLSRARIVQEGEDLTVVAWGQQLTAAKIAAEEISQKTGASVEVIDLRTLLPWDIETVEESVNKTGRLVVTHEAPITSGFGAEIVATIMDRCFWKLESPPKRVCGYDTPFPLIYEPLYVPSINRVFDAMSEALGDA